MIQKNVTLKEMPALADLLVEKLNQTRILTFEGDLGAGKTTLIGMILKALGVTEPIQSPTYTYVSLYFLPNGYTLYHFDLYRIGSLDAFIEQGFDEFLSQPQSYHCIEWPLVIASLLKKYPFCSVFLTYTSAETRFITLK